jgi:hypothetical protein
MNEMSRKIIYRKQLLRAIDAFLEGTPASIARGKSIVKRCQKTLGTSFFEEPPTFTLDSIIWDSYFHPLTDSLYYTSQEYLEETRRTILGYPPYENTRERFFIQHDFRPQFTPDETAWYNQLLDTLAFIESIPFAQIAEACVEARNKKIPGNTILATTSEAAGVQERYDTYEQQITAIKALQDRMPQPEHVGEELLHRLVLHEVTAIVTAVDIRMSAVYAGHPTPVPPHTGAASIADMTESLAWARRALHALAGESSLYVSWRFAKAASFHSDVLLLSLH